MRLLPVFATWVFPAGTLSHDGFRARTGFRGHFRAEFVHRALFGKIARGPPPPGLERVKPFYA